MYSGREGALGVEKAPRRQHRSQELDNMVQWLVDHKVERKQARKFIIQTGCDSLHGMAVYMRFQLPPLHLANVECVDYEMNSLLGVRGPNAMKIIKDLDVLNAVNVDVNHEATQHLFNTGLLTSLSPSMMGNGLDHSPVPSGRNLTTSGANLASPKSTPTYKPRSLMSPGSGVPNLDVVPSLASMGSRLASPLPESPEPLKPPLGYFKTYNNPFQSALSQQTAGDAYIDVGGPGGGGFVGEIPSATSAGGLHYHNPKAADPNARVNPVYSFSDNSAPHSTSLSVAGVSAGTKLQAQQTALQAVNDARERATARGGQAERYGSRRQSPGRGRGRGSTSMSPPPPPGGAMHRSPGRSPSRNGPRSSSRRGGAIAEGYESYEASALGEGVKAHDKQKWPALPDEYLTSINNSEAGDMAGPMGRDIRSGLLATAGASEAIASERLPGVPTCSKAIDPGAYNQANSMLRSQLPHFHATVKVRTHWDHIFVWLIQIVSLLTYIGVRAVYLISGETAALGQKGVSIPYSWLVLLAEVGLGCSGVYLRQNFWKQTTDFRVVPPKELNKMTRAVSHTGMKQTVHVLIATYTEPAVTVRECVLRCLVAPEPIYMEKMIYVCDDGHAKSEGPKKRAMVEELRILGHTNVFYVGDRIKKPGQLNGKSANLNHVLLRKIYPTVRKAEEVPIKDIFMVMDCDHMVKPDIFNRMGPCMLDERVAVCLVPQCFHNLIYPDALDAANGDFMFGRLPFFFGAGVLFVTGTNVMVRSRSAFEVCKFADANSEATCDGEDHRQLFTVDEISEDVVLGSRLHAAGFKGVFIAQNLATGEVPLEARAMWRQRFRWFKGGHLFLLSPTSVFFDKSRHMSFYQKSLYWICLVANVLSIIADPILLALPPLCLVFQVCVYGLDQLLFWTHVMHTFVTQFAGMYYADWSRVVDALKAHIASRVLWFTTVKACINTVMVLTGWKKSGVFKATPKLGENPADLAPSARLPDVATSKSGSEGEPGAVTDSNTKADKTGGLNLHHVHEGLSKVTEVRKHCLPFDGTLDFWVIMGITLMALFSVAVGVYDLYKKNSLMTFDIDNESLKWLAIAWALHEAMPGMVFAGYLATWDVWPRFLKFWLPFVSIAVAGSILFVETRVAIAFIQQARS